MSGENLPSTADLEKRASAFLLPEEALPFTQDAKSDDLIPSSSETPCELPCGLRNYGSESFIEDYNKIPIQTRREYVDKIIKIMSTWDNTKTQPRPLIFQLKESGEIVLQPPPRRSQTVKMTFDEILKEEWIGQYDLHFWIPDSCLIGVEDKEKSFRREFFAVGCLVYQILKGETVWQSFSGPQAQTLFEKGVYPSDVKGLSHWRVVLSYWSWEYVAEVSKGQKVKKALSIAKNVAIGGIVVGGAVALTAILSPIIIPALGFGSAGVGAGTIAAGWQSAIGVVEAGSLFAILQSAGAGGAAGAAAITAVALGGTGTVVAAGAVAGASAGLEGNVLRDEDLFALFLQVVRKAPHDTGEDSGDKAKL
ncbi:hypothetical protein TWF718_009622 [Orbilia javanica]|uniref:Uncharacterized protein n=1 Tax=Orbilia javanica TaxID=47235 RepID=A0AAN8RFQ9_9PEZI